MPPKHHAAHDAQAKATVELYAMADAMHARALAQWRDLMQHAQAGEWDAAEAALQAMRASQRTAEELQAEADAS